jgi:hypothetical protein
MQARYLTFPLIQDEIISAINYGIIGPSGTNTLTYSMKCKISWHGPAEAFKSDGTKPKFQGAIGDHTDEITLTRTITPEYVVFGTDIALFFFSGARRGPMFTNFSSLGDRNTVIPTYASLPDPNSPPASRLYTWNGSDFLGWSLGTGPNWNSEPLDTNRTEQAFDDTDNLGIKQSAPSNSAANSIDCQINMVSFIPNSTYVGPNGIKSIYGMVASNRCSHQDNLVDSIQFCKLGETATFPEAPSQVISLGSSPGPSGVASILASPDIGMFVLDANAFNNWT